MKITQELLDDLTAKAKASPRLRMNMDLRNSPEDQSQRMLNAIEPGSEVPVHRHRLSSETVVCLRGRLVEEYSRWTVAYGSFLRVRHRDSRGQGWALCAPGGGGCSSVGDDLFALVDVRIE